MLARPFASDTVSARAVCRLKCSVVANVAAGPAPGPRAAAGASGSDGPRRDAMIVGAHGAYLKGWRNASPAFSPTTGNTIRLEVPLSRRRSGSRPCSGPTRARPCNEHRGVCRAPQTCVECALAAHDIAPVSHPGLTTGSTGRAPRAASSGRAAQTGECGSRRSAPWEQPGGHPREPPPVVAKRGSRLRCSGFVLLLAGVLLRQRGRGNP